MALSTATVDESTFVEESELFGSEARLSWVLAGQAGLLGAIAFTHSAGYFLTFMTGNSERAVLGFFRDEPWLSITATALLAAFISGVVIASLCRRHIWVAHPHGPTVLTTRADVISADHCRGSSGAGEADRPRSRRP